MKLNRGEKIRLKDGVLSHLEIREWDFEGFVEGMVSLTLPDIPYTIWVKEDRIDWARDFQLISNEFLLANTEDP